MLHANGAAYASPGPCPGLGCATPAGQGCRHGRWGRPKPAASHAFLRRNLLKKYSGEIRRTFKALNTISSPRPKSSLDRTPSLQFTVLKYASTAATCSNVIAAVRSGIMERPCRYLATLMSAIGTRIAAPPISS